MHKCPIQIQWLVHPEAAPAELMGAAALSSAPAGPAWPSPAGQSWVDRVDISGGLTIFQLVHRFASHEPNRTVPLGEFRLACSEPALTVHTLHGGAALHRDLQSGEDLSLTPGNDLFCHGSGGQFMPIADAAQDLTMTALVVTDRALYELMGEEATQQLLGQLNLRDTPSIELAPIPHMVTEPLRQCLSSGCSGPLHALYAQAKVLDYLWKLATFVGSRGPMRSSGRRAISTARAVHDYVLNLEGVMPTLPHLAKMFGASPQRLNRYFLQEYGQTIYALVSSHRLNQAHQALAESAIPIKTIAARLGYSHVNHFAHAFKAKFGYTPGSLRSPA